VDDEFGVEGDHAHQRDVVEEHAEAWSKESERETGWKLIKTTGN